MKYLIIFLVILFSSSLYGDTDPITKKTDPNKVEVAESSAADTKYLLKSIVLDKNTVTEDMVIESFNVDFDQCEVSWSFICPDGVGGGSGDASIPCNTILQFAMMLWNNACG